MHDNNAYSKCIEILNKYKVFYVSSENDDSVLVAVSPRITLNRYISWFDLSRNRKMKIKDIVQKDESKLCFQRQMNDGSIITYLMIPITLDLYNLHIKNRLIVPKDFLVEKELIDELLKKKEFC